VVTRNAAVRWCAHRQADWVTLSTGEVVATVCVECLAALPADYIARQVARAEREAFCEHSETTELTTLSDPTPVIVCRACDFTEAMAEAMTEALADPSRVPVVLQVPDPGMVQFIRFPS
jgi:hypothetical protein